MTWRSVAAGVPARDMSSESLHIVGKLRRDLRPWGSLNPEQIKPTFIAYSPM
jgi:hypothetical protein